MPGPKAASAWRARHRATAPENPSGVVEGWRIKMMPEYGAEIPLWDDGGLTSQDPGELHRELGLSPDLLADLVAWQSEWDDVSSASVSDDTVPDQPLPHGWKPDHDRRGRALFARLRAEIDPRYAVRLHL